MKKRTAKGSVLDISIRGDELEQHRIQLEHNLQHTDLSLRLSSASEDEGDHHHDNYQNASSVEYPRHNSAPSPFPEFPSYSAHRSRDLYGDEDTHSQMAAWSYRTGDDEEGINPYGGESMSTAAHHASALTLSAGLGGGRHARRDVSISGAEYDPERPLHEMIAGVDSKLSVFDMDPSRSKYPGMGSVTYDPLVVDSTAELDRILKSGYAAPPSLRSRISSPLSSASSAASDSEGGGSGAQSRPKLSDHLRHVSFSPKRPRSAQSNRTASPVPMSPLGSRANNESMNMPTPRPSRRSNIFPSYVSTPPSQQPEVRLQPPTPSTTGSRLTRTAKIEKQAGTHRQFSSSISRSQQHQQQGESSSSNTRPGSAPMPGHSPERNPFSNVENHPAEVSFAPSVSVRRPTPRKASVRDTTQTPRSKVHLPDVTGLTSAVESPAKFGIEYAPYRADDRPRDSEARLLQTLSAVQTKLHHLDEENGISRRRVRELEMELEECKREVARERTRLLEREEVIVQQQRDMSFSRRKGAKGKGKAREVEPEEVGDVSVRYKEAVEEKKALEALINSLRTHLTRLTSELASHQELLMELRNLRESDSRALREKGSEITQLKEEVERLAGEVEVLRGVVEEGLKERRMGREVSDVQSQADIAMSQDIEEEGEEEEEEEEERHEELEEESDEDAEYRSLHRSVDEEDEEPEPFDPSSIQGSSRANIGAGDRTMRTDHATLGSSTNLGASTVTAPEDRDEQLIDTDELERISAEVEERRSDRSGNESLVSLARSRRSGSPSLIRPRSLSPIRPGSPSPIRSQRRAAVAEEEEEEERERAASPALTSYRHQRSGHQQQRQRPTASSSRPSAPTPGQEARHSRRSHPPEPAELETPFPQIRGERLERLFFSAPEHNAKTCTVCYRRRYRDRPSSPLWAKHRRHQHHEAEEEEDEEEDEGFAEGSDDAPAPVESKGKQREHGQGHVTFSEDPGYWRQAGQKEGLPPQTVVMRVIRELEDDFTHYKSIYVELADQYKDMDAMSNVRKRNILAQHLREVVDILEQKGDQIASLSDLLSFKDKPVAESVVPERPRSVPGGPSSAWSRRARGPS